MKHTGWLALWFVGTIIGHVGAQGSEEVLLLGVAAALWVWLAWLGLDAIAARWHLRIERKP